MRTLGVFSALVGLALAGVVPAWAARPVTIGYAGGSALRGLHVVERLAPLHVAVVSTNDPAALRLRPGILWVQHPVRRTHEGAPLVHAQRVSAAAEWQWSADRENLVSAAIQHAASAITIGIVDTGADLSTPDLAAKPAVTYNVITGDPTVSDQIGHGTFVASLAAGTAANGQGVQGFGGDAALMVVQANRSANTFTDVDEAAGIVWAVDHGAQIVNLSIGGTSTSQVERDAINYAISHGVLLVAAAGNDGTSGNLPSYPAALLGTHGLAVAASTAAGGHASFSTSASYVSIAAPGVHVLGATSPTSSSTAFPRAVLSGVAGTYAFGTGTSYSAPQVAGAAALVWGANPALTADGVIQVLEQTAHGTGAWSPQLGWGVLDVAAAVAQATGAPLPPAPLPPVVTAPVATKAKTAPKPAHARRVSLKTTKRAG